MKKKIEDWPSIKKKLRCLDVFAGCGGNLYILNCLIANLSLAITSRTARAHLVTVLPQAHHVAFYSISPSQYGYFDVCMLF